MKHDVKNGYTQIAHTLLEDMAAINLSGADFRVIFWIWRNSYSRHKKETQKTAIREIARKINLSPGTTFRTIKSLNDREIIRAKDGVFSFNKYAVKPFSTGNGAFSTGNAPRSPQETAPFSTGNAPPQGSNEIINICCNADRADGASKKLIKRGGEGESAADRPQVSEKGGTGGDLLRGEFSEAEIFKIGDAYIKAKKLKLADDKARRAFLKRGKTFYAIKDLLTLAAGNSDRVIEAIGDLAEYYGDKDWSLSWIADKDFVEWDRERMEKTNGKK